MKYLIFLLLLGACSSGGKSPKHVIGNDTTSTISEASTIKSLQLPIDSFFIDSKILEASQFGCVGDAVQLNDFSIKDNQLSSPSATFSSKDVGKIYSIALAGKNGEHLIGKIIKYVSINVVLVDKVAQKEVNMQLGSYGTDNLTSLQTAFDTAIQKNAVLHVPEGIYLLGEKNEKTGKNYVQINMNKPNQNFVLIGDGRGKTIFRELDGKTQRQGRFTKMFYHYLKDAPEVGNIYLSRFTLDKNGRSITKPPTTKYEWEQAHAWSWAGSGSNPVTSIESITINEIEIYDKIGAGINFSSSPTKVGAFTASHIYSTNFLGTRSNSINYGARGDLEISCFSDNIQMSDLELDYIQIEPVSRSAADKDNRRNTTIRDSRIDKIEYTEGDTKNPNFSILSLENTSSKNFTIRSLVFTADRCDLTIPNIINSVDGKFINSIVRLPYNKADNSIISVNSSWLRTLGAVNNKILFENCEFLIDNELPDIRPKGFAILASGNTDRVTKNDITVRGCNFDSRLMGSIDAYANGNWLVENNRLAGHKEAIIVGGYKNFFSRVIVKNNDYTLLKQGAKNISINNHNSLWQLNVNETLSEEKWAIQEKGAVGNLNQQYKQRPVLLKN